MKYIILQYKRYVLLILDKYRFITLFMKYFLFKEKTLLFWWFKIFDTVPYIVWCMLFRSTPVEFRGKLGKVRLGTNWADIQRSHNIFYLYCTVYKHKLKQRVLTNYSRFFPVRETSEKFLFSPVCKLWTSHFLLSLHKKYDIMCSSRLHKLEQHRGS
jgi:hypothetical protein